jgi:hypothetical protein
MHEPSMAHASALPTWRKSADNLVRVARVRLDRKPIIQQQDAIRAGAIIVVHFCSPWDPPRGDKIDPMRRAKPGDTCVWPMVEHVSERHQAAAALRCGVHAFRDVVRGRGDWRGGGVYSRCYGPPEIALGDGKAIAHRDMIGEGSMGACISKQQWRCIECFRGKKTNRQSVSH